MRRRDLLAGLSLVPLAAPAVAQCVLPGFPRSNRPGRCEAAIVGPPTLGLDFLTPGTLDPRITFTRASTGSYFNAAGVMQAATTNAPRWDYDPATLQLRGLLLEEPRTNSALRSGDLTVAATWVPVSITTAAGPDLSPDGVQSMTRIIETAANAVHYMAQAITTTAATAYTASVFAKGAQVRYLQLIGDDGTNGAFATFDLQTGTISGAVAARGSGSGIAAVIQSVGNGVYRCSVTATIAGTTGRHAIVLANSGNPGYAPGYTGNIANGLSVWGAQMEAGAFVTSYIPTTTAAVARAKDQALLSKAGWYVPPGGSWFAEFVRLNKVPTTGLTRLIQEGAAIGTTQLFVGVNGELGQYDVSFVRMTTNTHPSSSVAKAASTYQAGTGRLCLDGGTVFSSVMTTGYNDTATPAAIFQTSVIAESVTGYIRRLSYWTSILTDAEMQQITS